MLSVDLDAVYVNEGNLDLLENVFDLMNEQTQGIVNILRSVRQALLNSGVNRETFLFMELHEKLVVGGFSAEVATSTVTSLSRWYEDFDSVDLASLEAFEFRIVAESFVRQCQAQRD